MYIVVFIVAILLLAMERRIKRPPNARSPYNAAAASLFLPGLGQLYNGETRKALLVWAGGSVLILLAALFGLLFRFWGMATIIILGFVLWFTALINAVQTAKQLQEYRPTAVNRWFVYVSAVVVAALVSVPVTGALGARAFRIPSESMLPTLYVGDFIMTRLESPQSYDDKRGDIVVFLYPGDNRTHYVDRVVAFSGETFEIRDRQILVDGQSVEEPWARVLGQSLRNPHYTFGPIVVPEGALFMLGDNLDNSADSRIWGPLPRENIVGVAEYIYFSWDFRKKRVRTNRIGIEL